MTFTHSRIFYLSILFTAAFLLTSCAAHETFNNLVRAGDTVVITAGNIPGVKKEDISITIMSSGTTFEIPANDPAIRSMVNLYPDPLSSLIVSRETGQEQTPFADTYIALLNQNLASKENPGDKDWFQTTILLDLPSNLPLGTAYILVNTVEGTITYSTLEVVEGNGAPDILGPTDAMISSFGRVPHYTINLQSTQVPHAIELSLTHDADSTTGGTGKAFVVNPIGYQKNLAWSDDGSNMKVIITPAHDNSIMDTIDFKFYVAGGLTNLAVQSVKGYDANGNDITGISASINNN